MRTIERNCEFENIGFPNLEIWMNKVVLKLLTLSKITQGPKIFYSAIYN